MTTTLILAEDPEAARQHAVAQLDEFDDGEKAFIWVPNLSGRANTAVVDKEGAVELEGFDNHLEAVILGSRLAQQSSWVEAVLAEGLERWAENLQRRYPGDDDKIDSERISLLGVIDNGMADLVLISRPASSLGEDDVSPEARAFLERTLNDLRDKADDVVEL